MGDLELHGDALEPIGQRAIGRRSARRAARAQARDVGADLIEQAIRGVSGTSFAQFGRLTIRLVAPTRLGADIDFMPHAHLWSNPPEINRFAAALTARANRARAGDA